MSIGDIMNCPAIVCRPGDTREDAARLMWECDYGVIPVVDNDNRIVGIVTDRDITMSAYTKGRSLNWLRVAQAMTVEVYSCREDDSIKSVERLMRDRQVRRLPVLDKKGRPVGVVSLGDVARFGAGQAPAKTYEGEPMEQDRGGHA